MRWVLQLLSILLLVQGVGGLINALRDGGGSWFVQLHVLPESLHVAASVVMVALGLLLWWAEARQKQSAAR